MTEYIIGIALILAGAAVLALAGLLYVNYRVIRARELGR